MTYKGWYTIKPKQLTNNQHLTDLGGVDVLLFICRLWVVCVTELLGSIGMIFEFHIWLFFSSS